MDTPVPSHTLDSVPRLYALHCEEEGDEPGGVIAWGLAFADGSAFTLWTDPYPGAGTAYGSLRTVERHHAPNVGADLVWVTGPEATARPAPGRVDPPLQFGAEHGVTDAPRQ